MGELSIRVDDLADGKVYQLLEAHFEEMRLYSPPESIHALDQAALRHPSVTVWSAWWVDEMAGCGALKQLSDRHGEIKSMRTVTRFLRRGVAAALLAQIIDEARARGYRQVSLETGSDEAFLPAVKLYERCNFVECGPFGNYKPDPYSRFFTRVLM